MRASSSRGVEGFGDVVVGAELKTDDAVDVLAAGGEHDDGRHVLGGAKAAQNLKPSSPGIIRSRMRASKCSRTQRRLIAAPFSLTNTWKPFFAEIAAQKVAKSGIVVNNENFGIAFHGGSPESASVANRNFGRDCRESRVGQ